MWWFKMKIDKLRKDIDDIDNKILELIKERMKTVKSIGRYKKKNHIDIVDKKRMKQIIQQKKEKAKGLSKGFIERLYSLIIEESCKIQEKIARE